jgi:hypothetical protein
MNLSLAQSWGDHVDVTQAVVVYLAMLGCLCLFCWFGNELSEQVRIAHFFTFIYLGLYSIHWTNLYNMFHFSNSVHLSTGGKCTACSLGVRLGGNPCPISALSGLYHRCSQ